MRIDSSGNLLHQRASNTISGTSVNKMTLGDGTGQYGAIIDVGSGSGYYGFAKNGAYNSRIRYNYATDSMAFDVNSSEAMRLDSGGKLNVNNTTGSGRVNISADNWPENALALYSAGIAGQANFAGMGFFNQDADSPIGQVADIYTNPTGTLSLTASGNPAIQLKYGSAGISGGTPALTVDNAGRVGIGTTTPSGAKLKVDGGATAGTVIQAGNAQGGVILGAESSTAYINTTSSTPLAFEINNSEKMRINSDGRVGIGTSSPSYSLHVQGNRLYLTNAGNTELMTTNTNGNVTGGIQALSNQSLRLGTITSYNCEMVVNNAVKGTWSANGLDVTGTAVATTDTDTTNTGNVGLQYSSNQNFVLTLTGNVTLTNTSSAGQGSVGQSGFITFIQDGTGGRAVSLGTDYETAGGAGITLSSAANTTDIVPYVIVASGRILLGTPQLAFS